MGTENNSIAIGDSARRAIGKIANGGASGHRAAEDFGVRGESEPVVQGTALIGLEMRKANIPQGAGIEKVFDLAPDGVKQSRMASVNQGGTSVTDNELIEGNRRSIRPQRNSKNIVGNFIHTGFHRGFMFAMTYLDRSFADLRSWQ
jgi:hypothetical protein